MRLALYPLVQQFQYRNGTNLVAGKIYVYYRGRTRLATIYKDQNGTIAQNPLTCDADGRAPCFVDTNYQYTIVVCDARGKELFSQDLDADNAININDALSGDSKLYIINTDGTISVDATSGDTWIQYDLGTFNKPLGVQSPLYWAQDDEECSIIGASGLATSEELADVSAVVDRKIDTTAAELALSGKVNVNDFTAYQEDITQSFQAVSDDVNFLSGAIDDIASGAHADIDFLSGKVDTKLDTTAFSDVSGNFLTAHQSLEGYLQNSDLEISENKITGISGVEIKGADLPEDVMTEDKISYDGNGKISAYNGSAFVGEGGGASYSAGDYIDITDDVISVTGLQPSGDYVEHDELTSYATQDDLTGLATKEEVSNKLDESAFSSVSGSFYSTANPSGFITGIDLTPYQTVEGMTAYQPVGNYQTAGDYYSASNPSGFITNDAITGLQPAGDYATNAQLSEVSSTITGMIPTGEFELCAGSGIELVDDPNAKTTTISVTAQGGNPEVEAEVIAHSADWNTVGDKLDTTAFSDVSGTFLTAHQSLDGYLQNTDLEISDNKITGISGVPLAAGGDVPEGVMVESDLEYNAVNEISGYNGSAIAQYGAEKQWLVHDDTLVHASNSAQYALGVNLSAVAQLLGVDETVLWSGDIVGSAASATLSEPISNFKYVMVFGNTDDGDGHGYPMTSPKLEVYSDHVQAAMWTSNGDYNKYVAFVLSGNEYKTLQYNVKAKNQSYTALNSNHIFKVIGIGRKEV